MDDSRADGRCRYRPADWLHRRRQPDADAGRIAAAPEIRSALGASPRAWSALVTEGFAPDARRAAGLPLAYWTGSACRWRLPANSCRGPESIGRRRPRGVVHGSARPRHPPCAVSRLLASIRVPPSHVVTASVRLPAGRYDSSVQVKTFYQQAVDAARSIPGVTAAATSTDRPLQVEERRTFSADASAQQLPGLSRVIAASWTAGSYFEALGIPLRRGRFFTDADGRTGGQVVIISEMLARRLWPDQDPIGRQIKWGIESDSRAMDDRRRRGRRREPERARHQHIPDLRADLAAARRAAVHQLLSHGPPPVRGTGTLPGAGRGSRRVQRLDRELPPPTPARSTMSWRIR